VEKAILFYYNDDTKIRKKIAPFFDLIFVIFLIAILLRVCFEIFNKTITDQIIQGFNSAIVFGSFGVVYAIDFHAIQKKDNPDMETEDNNNGSGKESDQSGDT
jgi:hypothetical protein